jgi:membrane protein implicated in regulation of membrane protease activity
MIGVIRALGPWSWLIAGLLLLALEMLAPGMFLLWLGLAALLVGLLSFAVDLSWQAQILAFALFSIAAVPLWRRIARNDGEDIGNTYLNRRTEALVGQVFTLEKPIVEGHGTVRIGDTVWRVTGPDLPAGHRVRVVRAEGANLSVESA